MYGRNQSGSSYSWPTVKGAIQAGSGGVCAFRSETKAIQGELGTLRAGRQSILTGTGPTQEWSADLATTLKGQISSPQ